MKVPFERTKVVVRRLPPGMSQAELMEKIDCQFAGRYKWVCFRPGRNSQKNQRHGHAYIEFNQSDDVVEFSEFFDGHVFVNEKGTQFRASVEYAPSQRVPKVWPKKDGREGTISKDLEYMEFLQHLAKPVENLPSAEIQLEKKEAERAGGVKETPIVTPLMDFVRQKRAAKNLSQISLLNGKLNRRTSGVSSGSSNSAPSKRGSEKQNVLNSMYVLRDSAKNANRKEKSAFILVSRRNKQRIPDKVIAVSAASRTKTLEDEIGTGSNRTAYGVTGASESVKQRVVLLKGKDSKVSAQIPPPDASGTVIRSILSKEARQLGLNVQSQHSEKDKQPPQPPIIRVISKDRISGSDGDKRSLDDKVSGNGMHYSGPNEKHDKRTRNKDKPERGVWTLRCSDSYHASNDPIRSSSINSQVSSENADDSKNSQHGIIEVDDLGGQSAHSGRGYSTIPCDLLLNAVARGDVTHATRSGGGRIIGVGHGSFSGTENGSHRPGDRRDLIHGLKEIDGSVNLAKGKHTKRAGAGHGSHEKQVWVQKAGSG